MMIRKLESTSKCPEDSKNVAYMCLEKQNTHQYAGLLYPNWRMYLSFLIFMIMISKL